jgi:hypothetical protein
VRLQETEDSQADVDLLFRLVTLLKDFPGNDNVSLVIETLERGPVELDMPDVRVSFCPELERRLGGILSNSSFRVA